eukprot:m.129570 g.129570  ORF g.129570 m.129570 type:complete len:115 (+) comp52315_c0_seq14:84-428(+)
MSSPTGSSELSPTARQRSIPSFSAHLRPVVHSLRDQWHQFGARFVRDTCQRDIFVAVMKRGHFALICHGFQCEFPRLLNADAEVILLLSNSLEFVQAGASQRLLRQRLPQPTPV